MKAFYLPLEKTIKRKFNENMKLESKVITPSSIAETQKTNTQLDTLFKVIRLFWVGVSFIMIFALSVLLTSIL